MEVKVIVKEKDVLSLSLIIVMIKKSIAKERVLASKSKATSLPKAKP
jgi:hypothetical protein